MTWPAWPGRTKNGSALMPDSSVGPLQGGARGLLPILLSRRQAQCHCACVLSCATCCIPSAQAPGTSLTSSTSHMHGAQYRQPSVPCSGGRLPTSSARRPGRSAKPWAARPHQFCRDADRRGHSATGCRACTAQVLPFPSSCAAPAALLYRRTWPTYHALCRPGPLYRHCTGRLGPDGSLLREGTEASAHTMLCTACRAREGCAPALVLYAHYPLPVMAEPDTKPWQGVAASAARPRRGTLLDVLTRHRVTAALSGHLHSAFGRRMHRLHAAPQGGARIAALHRLPRHAGGDPRSFSSDACSTVFSSALAMKCLGLGPAGGCRCLTLAWRVTYAASRIPSAVDRAYGGAGDGGVEGRPALPAAQPRWRRPLILRPALPHARPAADGSGRP